MYSIIFPVHKVCSLKGVLLIPYERGGKMTVYESLMIMINFGGLILNTVLLIFNIMMIVTSSQKKK
ncbi:hypothetical protein BS34A_23750 [Bacillus subtilis]|nr:hypothetical protein BSUA_02318 [Bacillus subtilis subsp. subtilis str. JH642 substr. AG174]AIC44830.1 hypothetical protein BSUB_02318 [Bacillus subtilis subsp. subtilis str. AG1839]AQR82162.1 hypothetical protein GP2222_23060 [Bacillus subtilis subsp. subtilis str. 168]KIX81218.1 hypothetical protein TV00_03001 [Bacillus subtilis]AQR86376.1 hypothetical protein GP2223_23070 [Bacillus subtilis subsp. subtilis str. 168]